MAIVQILNGPTVQAGSGPIPLELQQSGPRGPKGWTPVITGVSDGGRHLLFIDWTGGVNPKPTAGYLGENSLVADPAQALSLTGKGLANISQEPNADLKFTYSDGSTQTIPAYFAPMIAAAAQVAQDTQTVSDDKDTVLQARQDVENRQTDIAGRHQDIVIKHADVVYAHNHIMNMEVAVDADAQAVEISRGIVQTHADNFEAQKNYFNAQLSEIDADVVAIESSRQQMVAIQEDVNIKKGQIDATKTANDATKAAIDTTAAQVEAKRVEVNNVTAQASNIVFNGSTDFPTIAPMFYWHCDQGELDPRIDLSYTGNLSVTDHRGVLRAVPQGARALDFDPVTRACLGFPAWEGRTNLFTNSTYVEGWGYLYLTPTTDPTVKAPDGSSAVYFTDSGVNSTHHIRRSNIQAYSTTYTYSVYAKARSNQTSVRMLTLLDTTQAGVNFNLTTQTITSANGPGYISSSMKHVGDGWYRLSMTYTSNAAGTNNYIDIRLLNSAGFESYAPDGTNSVYLWGPQFEVGNFATPYIPTSGATVWRGAMNAQIQGLAFQQIFAGLTEFTMVLEANILTAGLDQHLLSYLFNGNSFYAFRKIVNNTLAVNIRQDGQPSNDLYFPGSFTTGMVRFACKFKPGDFRASCNGGTVISNTSQHTFVPNRLQIGSQTGTPAGGQYIREVAVYGPGITDAQLQALSRL